LEALVEPLQLLCDDLAQVAPREPAEDDKLIQAVEELGAELVRG
jgi:hypothetical protein